MAERFEDVARAVFDDGVRHDAAQPDRSSRRLHLDPDAAALLSVVCEAMAAVRVLEIGTSTGHSTLWLARAVQDHGGPVLCVDVDADSQRAAAANLARAELLRHVDLRCADGGQVLGELPDGSQDVVFLDSDRSRYRSWWPDVRRVLRDGGLLAVDNVLSHPDQVADLRALVDADPGLRSTVSAVGKGLLLAVKRVWWTGPAESRHREIP
jgi:predicted O-methyltransferase YrrM